MSEPVQLVGLDFGTTTSSAVVATARLTHNAVTGRTELDQVQQSFRSEKVFTPLCGDLLDEARLEAFLDAWLSTGCVCPERVFGGGALLTGLTARRTNATALVQLVRRRLGQALVARADDPCLESWLAFMGSCAALSRAHPETSILNLDIGGGTTNLALGRAGEVSRTGCLLVGARHFQVEPGSYRLVRLSPYARSLLDYLGISRACGDGLDERERVAILDFYVGLLESAVRGDRFADPISRLHEQVSFRLPAEVGSLALTLSGGVGELVYAHLQGGSWPSTTAFGDLGIDLARRLVSSPLLGPHLQLLRPATAGRATSYGLLLHSTEISGSTVYLSNLALLPLSDVPIFGSISDNSFEAPLRDLLQLVRHSSHGGCLQVTLASAGAATVRALGGRLAKIVREIDMPRERPLVLLVRENVGKTLGHYVTDWGSLPVQLMVIDEIAVRDAQYVQIGRPRGQVIPVSYYGLNP
jgi:ethanolamine utilization protein EutA